MLKLDAVNRMLTSIGQTPASTVIENYHPDVLSALSVILSASKKIQAKGYWFNTDHNLTLAPNAITGEILLPSTTLSVDPVDTTLHYVQRGSRLYNSSNSTFEIGVPVQVTLIQDLDFEQLPEVAANYIMEDSLYIFVRDRIGDNVKMQEIKTDREMARRLLNAEDIRYSGISLSNNPAVASMFSNVRPSR